jgi:FG-GAP-like repeat
MLHRFLAAALVMGATASLSGQSSVSFELYGDTYAVPNPNAIVSGDFNNDGKPDLVQCCNSTGLIFRAGNGDGSFQGAATAASAPEGAAALVAADVNGDGKLDLVGLPAYGNYPAAPNGTGLAIWLGNGDGTFQAPVVYPTTDSNQDVAVGNFFSDGRLDIAVGETNGLIELFRNEGDGTFAADGSINLGSGTYMTLAAGDLNSTGVSDLAAATSNGSTGAVYALWNDGKGNFTQQELSSSYALPVVGMSRVNGDGMMDILVSYTCNPTPSGMEKGPEYQACAGFDVYYGQGDNHLYKRTVVTDPGVYNVGRPFGVDVNGDGYGDIADAGGLGSWASFGLLVWQGNADGSFQQTAQDFITNTSSVGSMTAADFARNGMMSFAISQDTDQNAAFFINSTDRGACGTYTISPTVTVCQPVNNTYSPSPVRVDANGYDTTPMTAMQEYIDGTLEYSKPVSRFDTTFPVSDGAHSFVTKGWDTSGLSFVADRTITVFSDAPGAVCPATTNSASICLPSGTSISSPVQILANGNTGTVVPTSAQLYVNGTLAVNNEGYCYGNGNCSGGTTYVNTTQNLSSGTYDLVFKLWDANGNVYQAQKTITVN